MREGNRGGELSWGDTHEGQDGTVFFSQEKRQNIKDIVSKDWARLLVIYLEISALKG